MAALDLPERFFASRLSEGSRSFFQERTASLLARLASKYPSRSLAAEAGALKGCKVPDRSSGRPLRTVADFAAPACKFIRRMFLQVLRRQGLRRHHAGHRVRRHVQNRSALDAGERVLAQAVNQNELYHG